MQNILVVDDDRTYRTIMARALSRAGFDVSQAASGTAVLERLQTKPPAAVVTDIQMPDIDGLELIRTIRSTGHRIAIIAVSGGNPSLDLLRAASLYGADAALRKPLDLARLVAVVQSLLTENPNWTPAPN